MLQKSFLPSATVTSAHQFLQRPPTLSSLLLPLSHLPVAWRPPNSLEASRPPPLSHAGPPTPSPCSPTPLLMPTARCTQHGLAHAPLPPTQSHGGPRVLSPACIALVKLRSQSLRQHLPTPPSPQSPHPAYLGPTAVLIPPLSLITSSTRLCLRPLLGYTPFLCRSLPCRAHV